jgi:MFS family permease
VNEKEPENRKAARVLAVLFAVSVLNFVDRQILSILAGPVKADLHITDANLGFLYGTAFGAFYAIFGIPLGVYADLGSRRKLIAWGLALWSVMTIASGFASGFAMLALARVLVGVGEATASPASSSLIADLFPKERRGTALGIYALGIYVGVGLSSFIGGVVVDGWSRAFPSGHEPFGLHGWQAAFVVAGIPGLLLLPLVLSFREPVRGAMEETAAAPVPRPAPDRSPFLVAATEALALVPPSSFVLLVAQGVPLAPNVAAFAGLALAAGGLTLRFGDATQWVCVAVGLYAVVTMAQRLRTREPEAFALIFKTPSLSLATLAFSCLSFTGYAISLWAAPFFIRYHGFRASEIGGILGLISAVCGGAGVAMGGALSDRFRASLPWGRLLVGILNAVIPLPLLVAALNVDDRITALTLFACAQIFAAMWLGAGSSVVQDLVLPHMRARATAVFLLFVTLISLSLGPYLVGRLSDHWEHNLRLAFTASTFAYVVAFALFVMASREIARDEETRHARAAAARG